MFSALQYAYYFGFFVVESFWSGSSTVSGTIPIWAWACARNNPQCYEYVSRIYSSHLRRLKLLLKVARCQDSHARRGGSSWFWYQKDRVLVQITLVRFGSNLTRLVTISYSGFRCYSLNPCPYYWDSDRSHLNSLINQLTGLELYVNQAISPSW